MASETAPYPVLRPRAPSRIGTGVRGLDFILNGGLTKSRTYLVEGPPGSGKTTLGLQFLLEGARRGESTLYIALSESTEEIEEVAASHGWSLEGLEILDLQNEDGPLGAEGQYTLFHPAEVELGEITDVLLQRVEQTRPKRLVLDSLSELQLLARDPLRYRQQILNLKKQASDIGCTALLLSAAARDDFQLASAVHGVIELQSSISDSGVQQRSLRVQKLRGSPFREGLHEIALANGGMRVYPWHCASEQALPVE